MTVIEPTAPAPIALTWLSDDVLLVVGPYGGWPELSVSLDDSDSEAIGMAQFSPSSIRDSLSVVVLRLGTARPSRMIGLTLRFVGQMGEFALDDDDLGERTVHLSDLILEHLAPMTAAERDETLSFLVEATLIGAAPGESLAESMTTIRAALRTPLPPVSVRTKRRGGFHIETVVAGDEHTVYLRGWIGVPDDQIERVIAVSPEGERVELSSWHRPHRTDVEEFLGYPTGSALHLGFAAHLTTVAPSCRTTGWIVEVHQRNGLAAEVEAPPVVTDIVEGRRILLGDLGMEPSDDDRLVAAHLSPTFAAMQRRRHRSSVVRAVDEWGPAPRRAAVSVVIPLYGRTDFVEHQMAQFALDMTLSEVELIYVLDDPRLADAFRAEAGRLFRLYGVPFRLVVLDENLGFAGANNAGVALARGRHLLLCNSDVFPEKPGWIMALSSVLYARPKVAAVAPMLVYEDQSLQHAGMYFDRPAGVTHWRNEHYFKGIHRSFEPANVARVVPAASAACLMLDTDQYRRLGGLSGGYLQGDYEDSDLCLRIRAAGGDIWYEPSIAAFHLEGMSYPTPERVLYGRYNAWLHQSLWDEQITEIMSDPAVRPANVAARKRPVG